VRCECGCDEGEVLDDVAQFCLEEALRMIVDHEKVRTATSASTYTEVPAGMEGAEDFAAEARALADRHRQAMGR
jgi:hypothetical protein